MYGAGAAMGFTPHETGLMTLWQFNHAVDGWKRVHSTENEQPDLTADEIDDLGNFLDQPPVWDN